MRAASAARAVLPSSIQLSIGPTPGIWLRWSITQTESKPDDSAVCAIAVSFSSSCSGSTPGKLKLGICETDAAGSWNMGALAFNSAARLVTRNAAADRRSARLGVARR